MLPESIIDTSSSKQSFLESITMRDKEFYRKTLGWIRGPIAAYVVLAILYIIVIPKKFFWFSWHPFAALIGFVGLASNATLIKKIGGLENTRTHGILMSTATAFALFAGYVIYTNKEMNKRQHYTTNHGKLGLIVILSYLSLGIAGAVFLHPDFGLLKTNQTVRKFHKYAGLITTALAWLACCSGFATLHQSLIEKVIFAVPLVVMGYYVLL